MLSTKLLALKLVRWLRKPRPQSRKLYWHFTPIWVPEELSAFGFLTDESASDGPLWRHKVTRWLELPEDHPEKQALRPQAEKELVFEEVRAAEFPHLPSRRRCIYLIPREHDPVRLALRMGFNLKGRTLLLGAPFNEPAPKLHHADITHLDCNDLAGDRAALEARARLYWSGKRSKTPHIEVLFEGHFHGRVVLRAGEMPPT